MIAEPSAKNSGIETTTASMWLLYSSCFKIVAVPTGTVDFSTMILGDGAPKHTLQIVLTTAKKAVISVCCPIDFG